MADTVSQYRQIEVAIETIPRGTPIDDHPLVVVKERTSEHEEQSA